MRAETWFWIIVVVLASAYLIYSHVNRRRLNIALGKLPELYDAARAGFLSGSRALAYSTQPQHAMLVALEAISEMREGQPPPAFADLSKRERRCVELLHAATCMSDREFKRTLARLSKQEQNAFQQLRDIYDGPAPRKPYARAMVDRVAVYWRSRREAKLAAERQRAADEYWSRFDELEISCVLEWLKTEAPRDPDMWHKLPGLNWDYPEIYDILLWVVTQPECDAATAILILQLMSPDVAMDLASGGTRWRRPGDLEPLESAEVKLLAMICMRSEKSSFVRRELAPDRLCTAERNAGLLDMMLTQKQGIEAAGRNVPFPLPEKLLSKPVPATVREPLTGFEVHDDRVLLPKARQTKH